MTFHVVSIFPEFFRGLFEHGVVARAIAKGTLRVRLHDLRQWTYDFHRSVDDRPFGGGEGMLMKPEPFFLAAEAIFPAPREAARQRIVLLSAQGPVFNQARARELSECEEVLLICGRYEGIDERVSTHLADEELSIGSYVLSGGELAAAVVMDAVARLRPGVLGNAGSAVNESFSSSEDELDCPHYTRPAVFRGLGVPDVLLSGDHDKIRAWRRAAAAQKEGRKQRL